MQADIAQLVERNLAKVEVASSSLVVRSERSLPVPTVPGKASVVGWPRGEATDCKSVYTGSNPVPTSTLHNSEKHDRAIGAAVARFPDTEEVTGSNPVSPTRETAGQRPFRGPLSMSRATYVHLLPRPKPHACVDRRSPIRRAAAARSARRTDGRRSDHRCGVTSRRRRTKPGTTSRERSRAPPALIRAATFSPTVSRNRPEVNIAVPELSSPDRNWDPVRRAASRSAEKTSSRLRLKGHRPRAVYRSSPQHDRDHP